MSGKVTLVEMGMRDGLQNESQILDVSTRVEMAQRLVAAGLKRIEIGAFVSPQWVPQMAGTSEVVREILKQSKNKNIFYSVLVPNERGMKDALNTDIKEIALFTAASDSFAKKNINCTVEESLDRFLPVIQMAKKNKIKVRGYISTCFYCPFEGRVSEKVVIKVAQFFHKNGIYEISIGDTIGAATVGEVRSLFLKLSKSIPRTKLAGHFHDTRGQALANILAAYQVGVRVFDTSVGGLGGCPYAPGASGNVATEDVVYMFDGMKIKTGISIGQLLEINTWISQKIKRELPSRVGRVGLPKIKGDLSVHN